jgi:hypothetical protein
MDRPVEPTQGPAEPIHGCSTRPCTLTLIGTTLHQIHHQRGPAANRWCRSLDLELKVAA